MTVVTMNLTKTKRNDKRARLVEAADQLFHHQGVSNTTLANIATLAEVPLGNVYYYFKSKDSIILAVIERRKQHMQAIFEQLNAENNIKTRLKDFITSTATVAETACNYGDALGSLCQELGKIGGTISEAASALMQDMITWCKTQYMQLGKDESAANNLSLNLISSLQGISLLTLTFKDPTYIARQTAFLATTIDAL